MKEDKIKLENKTYELKSHAFGDTRFTQMLRRLGFERTLPDIVVEWKPDAKWGWIVSLESLTFKYTPMVEQYDKITPREIRDWLKKNPHRVASKKFGL